ncbi:MAG: DUF4340 domain-containing protein, partial [Candidatus Hydrogenedentes bacterium]|nr:DUF4340 domain-containing protein [Candidatus Hydrogenedentota bacterium]
FDAGRLFDFKPGALRRVSIQVEDRSPTVGVTEGSGQWRIIAPHELDAQNEVWAKVAANLAELHRERIIEESPHDLAPYELDDPRLQIEFTTADGESHRVVFGKIGPMQINRYAQIDSGPVFLTPDAQYAQLNRQLLDLRQRYIFDVGPEGITRIELARIRQPDPDTPKPEGTFPIEEMGEVVIEQVAEGEWRMLEPFEANANTQLVQGLVKQLQFAVGHEYVDTPENLDDYFLNPPGARISIYSGKDAELQTLYLGGGTRTGEKHMMFAKRADAQTVFQVDGAIYGYFPKTPDAYRENRLLSRSALDLERVDYQAGDVSLTLEKGDDKRWRLVEPVEEPADQAMVSGFISTLLKIRGESFPPISMSEAGLADPPIMLKMAFKDDNAPVLIRIGKTTEDGQMHYATLDTGVITLVPAAHVRAITRELFDFREKRIFEIKPEDVKSVSLRFEDEDYVFAKDRRWTVEQPPEKIWDSQDDARALVEAVTRVDASGMAVASAPEDLAPYGLQDALVVLTVEMMNENGEIAAEGPLRIGAPVPDQSYLRFATVAGRPEIFHVNQSVIDKVREALEGVRDR